MKILYKDSGIIEHYNIDNDLNLVKRLQDHEMMIHFWQNEAILLGKLDTLLPKYKEAIEWLDTQNINYTVRKQGGLAIVSDLENLNISFCFKTSQFKELQKPYQCVSLYIKDICKSLGLDVDILSVDDSYCPGDYDLSVEGIKFAGIAQYRNKEAIIVSVSLFVNGNQQQRSRLIKEFYRVAQANKSKRQTYPEIDIHSMGTLSDLLKESLDIDVVKDVFMKSKIHICEK